jgi:beta-glucanase (GH16 family)
MLYKIFIPLCILSFACSPIPKQNKESQPVIATWQFEKTPVWADEFEQEGKPDPLKWGYDTGGHGWGNKELQFYTNGDNVNIANGILVIEARKEQKDSSHFTSTRLISKNKGDFLYGRFEARARMPKGRGLWPAIWMLPTDWEYGGWPKSGEIDIMEQVGYDPNTIHMSVHTEAYNHTAGTQKTAFTHLPTATDSFHVYRVDWTPHFIKGYIDNVLLFTFLKEKMHSDHKVWPFDKRFHWLLNLAVGGNWGGQKGIDETVFPAKFEIDYVRVFKLVQ